MVKKRRAKKISSLMQMFEGCVINENEKAASVKKLQSFWRYINKVLLFIDAFRLIFRILNMLVINFVRVMTVT